MSAIAEHKKEVDLLGPEYQPKPMRPALVAKKHVPSVKDMIGLSLPMIGSYAQLDNKQQAVAIIDEVRDVISCVIAP